MLVLHFGQLRFRLLFDRSAYLIFDLCACPGAGPQHHGTDGRLPVVVRFRLRLVERLLVLLADLVHFCRGLCLHRRLLLSNGLHFDVVSGLNRVQVHPRPALDPVR